MAEYLPEATDYYDLLTDFRQSGYRVLGDLICDIDDENHALERKQLLRGTDSANFAAMMTAYMEHSSYMGRFTFTTILEFKGLARVLTVIARGFMYHDADGNILDGDPRDRLDYVRKALCAWRKKVIQFQVPLFSENTKGAWILRFDDVIANALELGSLKNAEQELPQEFIERVSAVTPKGVPSLDLPRT